MNRPQGQDNDEDEGDNDNGGGLKIIVYDPGYVPPTFDFDEIEQLTFKDGGPLSLDQCVDTCPCCLTKNCMRINFFDSTLYFGRGRKSFIKKCQKHLDRIQTMGGICYIFPKDMYLTPENTNDHIQDLLKSVFVNNVKNHILKFEHVENKNTYYDWVYELSRSLDDTWDSFIGLIKRFDKEKITSLLQAIDNNTFMRAITHVRTNRRMKNAQFGGLWHVCVKHLQYTVHTKLIDDLFTNHNNVFEKMTKSQFVNYINCLLTNKKRAENPNLPNVHDFVNIERNVFENVDALF